MANLNDAILKDSIESTETFRKQFSRIQKDYGLALHEAQEFYKRKGELIKNSELQELKATAQNSAKSAKERAAAAKKAVELEKQLEMQAANSIITYKKTLYKKSSTAEKVDYQKLVQEKEQTHRKSLEEQYKHEYAKAAADGKSAQQLGVITRKFNHEKVESIKRERAARKAQVEEEKKLAQEAASESAKRSQATMGALKALGKQAFDDIKNIGKETGDELEKSGEEANKSLKGQSIGTALKSVGKAALGTLGAVSKMGEVSIKDLAANKAADSKKKAQEADANVADIEEALKALEGVNSEEAAKEREELQKELAEAKKEALAANNKATVDAMKAMAASAISDAYDQAFSAAENTMKSYQSHIDARLQGSDKSWKKANNMITNNLGLSTIVKTTNVIEKLKEAVDQGISYNVEQRAFLAEISDKIANTFNAFDASLLRLIKLQQADSTAARLGMEAILTKFLNSTFEDSSYLSNEADNISSIIIDASSQLTNAQANEFEYIVHKWLGSMSSVGISSEAINTIAEGINYLATGNVESMASNTQLTTMFAMAASRSNMEYSEILLEGLNADKTNKLLEGMLSYLADIAKGADNQVVKGAYGNILNLKASDFKAIENLSKSISSISSNTASYSSMIAETESQLSSLWTKVSLSEQLSNIYDNAIYSVASDMVNSPVTWAMQKMLNFMDKNQLDINIPFINAMGFGVDLNTSVKGLMRVGMGLAQGFSFMGTLISSLVSGGGTNLGAWGAKETTSRGSGMSSSTSTTLGDTSSSVYVTNTNEEDVKNSTLNEATDDAEETKEVTNKNTKSEKTFDDFYKATIGEPASEWIVTDERHLKAVYRDSAQYLHTQDERMTFLGESYLAVYDPTNYTLLSKTIDPHIEAVKTAVKTFETTFSGYGDGTTLNVDDTNTQSTLSGHFNKYSFNGSKLNVATSMDSFFNSLGSSAKYLPVQDDQLYKLLKGTKETSLSTIDGHIQDINTTLLKTLGTVIGSYVDSNNTNNTITIKQETISTEHKSNNAIKVINEDFGNLSKLGSLTFGTDNALGVEVNNIPTVKISGDGNTVNVGTPNVKISGTPSVSISGTPNVGINGTPTVKVKPNDDANGLLVKVQNASAIKSSVSTLNTQQVTTAIVNALKDNTSLYTTDTIANLLWRIEDLLKDLPNKDFQILNSDGGSVIPVKDASPKNNLAWNKGWTW